MKLSVIERITIEQLLPREFSVATFKIMTELRSALSFSEKEIKEFKIEERDLGITKDISWAMSKDKDISIGEKASEIICNVLKKLDETEKLNNVTYSLYLKFIGDGNN